MAINDKIKALLAKAASTDNQAEAEAFFAKAHELMEKHQLDVSDLETEDAVGYDRIYPKNGSVAPDWDFMLIFAVAKYFGCKAIRVKPNKHYEMEVVGRESARVTVVEMHKYLVATVRRLGRQHAGTMEKYDKNNRFAGYMNADQTTRAIGNALRSRLSSLAAERKVDAPTAAGKNALITLDAVLALFDQRHPNTTKLGKFSTNSTAREIASNIGLHQQVGRPSGALRLK
jgi:hypothetical protein